MVTDYRMPSLNGSELAHRLRTIDGCRDIPVLAVTGLQELLSDSSFKEMGFDHCLAKPLRLDEIKTVVGRLFGAQLGDSRRTTEKAMPDAADKNTGRTRTILLAEDYPANQQVAIMHLTSAGYRVDLACNGQEAVEMFRGNSYDLVLMDVEMPVLDGYAAAGQIREFEKTAGAARRPVPIIALTAHAIKGFEKKCLQAGMNACMTKPLRRRRFLSVVGEWTSQNVVESPPPAQSPTEPGNSADNGNAEGRNDRPMDWEVALDEFMGDETLLRRLAATFGQAVGGQVVTISQALSQNDAETVRKEAHAIKGGAANLCADALADAAGKLETIGLSGDLVDGRAALAAVSSELERLKGYLEHNGHGM